MRLGFDVDGVFADFNTNFIERVITETRKDLFPPRPFNITTWNYPQSYGYTAEDVAKTWDNNIVLDPTFWLRLGPYWDAMDRLAAIRKLAYEHDVYFLTARPGVRAKEQTEVWLATHAGDFMWTPTVLITGQKGEACHALDLDAYIDDKWENVEDVKIRAAACCRPFLLTRTWNDKHPFGDRVDDVGEMLDALSLPH